MGACVRQTTAGTLASLAHLSHPPALARLLSPLSYGGTH